MAIDMLSDHQSLLQTERITLRVSVPEDDEALIALFSDLAKTTHHLPVLLNQPWDAPRMAARRQARAHAELQGLARNFTIILLDQVIGQAGYRTLNAKRGELGIILAHAHHGRGLVWDVHLLLLSLGFENLLPGLEVVEWLTGEGNEPMRAVLRKMPGCQEAGIVVEGEEWGKQVKYRLEKKDWMECKAWLCERVDRLSTYILSK